MSYRGNDEVVWCRQVSDGKELWATKIADAHFGIGRQAQSGSSSTPTVAGSQIFVLGIGGTLASLRTNDGKLLWKKSLVSDFSGGVPQWGYSESPLVDGNKVIATPGGSAATLVALNTRDGEVVWQCEVPDADNAGYASSIAADIGGLRQYIQFLEGGVVGVAAQDGRFLWRYDHPSGRRANCATPIVQGNFVFAASAYENGGGLAKLARAGDNVTADEVYFTRDMRNHHGGIVLVNGFLYGFDNSNLTCLDFAKGTTMWSDRSVGKGSLMYADGNLYVRGEQGEVALVEATSKGYREKGRFEQPERSYEPAWPHPVVVGGRLYLRDQDKLLCYNVRK